MKPIYHYTTVHNLTLILDTGKIKPADTGVFPPEIPAVWLSTATRWEQTATKGITNNMGGSRNATLAEMVEKCGGLARIEIDRKHVNLIYPPKLRTELKIPKTTLNSLIKAGKCSGADPKEWHAVAGSIPKSAFVKIEVATETDPIFWSDVGSSS